MGRTGQCSLLPISCWQSVAELATVASLALLHFPFRGGMVTGQVECSINFAHGQQFYQCKTHFEWHLLIALLIDDRSLESDKKESKVTA